MHVFGFLGSLMFIVGFFAVLVVGGIKILPYLLRNARAFGHLLALFLYLAYHDGFGNTAVCGRFPR